REKPPIQWAHARSGPGLQEILRDEAEGPEVGRGQVAAAVSEIARDVTEHVRHLEGLAEAHALLTLLAQVPAPEAWAVGGVQNRPEGADAAGDEVRVAVELVERVEGGQARGIFPGEAGEVEEHAGRQRGEDRADFGAVRGRGRVGGSGESFAFLRPSWNFRSRTLPFCPSASTPWRKRSSIWAERERSLSSAPPRSATVRVGGGGSCAITARSSGSSVSLALQHGHSILKDFSATRSP